jgi:thiamine monophosphate synthase
VADGPGFSLLAITPPEGRVSADILEVWLQAGAQPQDIAVLLRSPGRALVDLLAPDGRLADLRRACDRRGFRLLASCEPSDLPHAVHAIDQVGLSGIQLRGDPSLDTPLRARGGLGDALVGRSVHGEPRGGHEYVDFSCVAPIFPPRTGSGDKQAVGVEALQRWCQARGAQIFALGGIQATNAGVCLEAGVVGLAGISSFFGDPDQVAQDVGSLVAAVATRHPHVPSPKSG